MTKKSIIQRNLKRSILILKYKQKRIHLQHQIKKSKNFVKILYFQKKFQKLPLNSLSVRFKNRCYCTGYSRSFYRFFGLSRHILREQFHNGFLPGLHKASW